MINRHSPGRWANENVYPVEETKPKAERGKYLIIARLRSPVRRLAAVSPIIDRTQVTGTAGTFQK